MLTRVYLDNDRCFVNFEWHPPQLALLTGRNGSGKTTLFKILGSIQRLVIDQEPVATLFPAEHLTRWDRRRQQTYELDLAVDGQTVSYRLVVDQGPRDGAASIAEEVVTSGTRPLFSFREGEVQLHREDGSGGATFAADARRSALSALPVRPENSRLSRFKEALSRIWHVAPSPQIVAESVGERSVPDVGLCDFVSWYRSVVGDSIKHSQYLDRVRPVIEGLQGLKLEKVGSRQQLLHVLAGELDAAGNLLQEQRYEYGELSEGQRLLLGLYALLVFGPLDDGLLLLDEPDNFLSLDEIQPWLRALEDRIESTGGQVFIISHHPEVINRIWAEHGVRFTRTLREPVRLDALAPVPGLTPAETVARGWG